MRHRLRMERKRRSFRRWKGSYKKNAFGSLKMEIAGTFQHAGEVLVKGLMMYTDVLKKYGMTTFPRLANGEVIQINF